MKNITLIDLLELVVCRIQEIEWDLENVYYRREVRLMVEDTLDLNRELAKALLRLRDTGSHRLQ